MRFERVPVADTDDKISVRVPAPVRVDAVWPSAPFRHSRQPWHAECVDDCTVLDREERRMIRDGAGHEQSAGTIRVQPASANRAQERRLQWPWVQRLSVRREPNNTPVSPVVHV